MEEMKNELDHEAIRQQIKGLLLQLEVNDEGVHIKLDNILEQTKKTNGRVTELEEKVKTLNKSMGIIELLWKHKWLIFIIFLGIYYLIDTLALDEIIKGLTKHFTP